MTEVPEDEAYFHAQFRRSNPTQGSLHTLIDGVKGKDSTWYLPGVACKRQLLVG